MVEGKFSRKLYIQLLAVISKNKQTGTLKVSVGRSSRTFMFADGHVIGVISNIKEESLKAQFEKLLPKENLEEHEAQLVENESIEERLLQLGLLTREQLEECMQKQLLHALKACIRWKRGTWKFTPVNVSIDPSLSTTVSTLDTLWLGVVQNLSSQDIFSAIGPIQQAGKLRSNHSISQLLPDFPNQKIIQKIEQILTNGPTLEELSNSLSKTEREFYDNGHLFRLIWLLYHSGSFENNKELTDLTTRLFQATETPEETEPASPPQEKSNISSKIEKDHRKRMGKDYYSFLGIEPDSNYTTIDKACKILVKRWKLIENKKKLTENAKKKISELLQGVVLVHQTLVKAEQREEYDRRLKQGRAPKVIPIQAASIDKLKKKSANRQKSKAFEPPKRHEGLDLIDSGKYKEGYAQLEKARLEDGNNPDIYAGIGWAIWNIRRNRNEAEGFLDIARQFNRRHLQSYLYLSKIALACNDHEAARLRLKAVLSLDPKSSWAKKTLNNLPQPDA